jgi:hypothetical protein
MSELGLTVLLYVISFGILLAGMLTDQTKS